MPDDLFRQVFGNLRIAAGINKAMAKTVKDRLLLVEAARNCDCPPLL
jgi:hypothetical protein